MRHTEWCNDFTGTLVVDNPHTAMTADLITAPLLQTLHLI